MIITKYKFMTSHTDRACKSITNKILNHLTSVIL